MATEGIIRRKGFSSVDKAWAVQALGYDPATKIWGPATDDPESKRPWSNTSIAKKLGSSKTTISGWRKNATVICESVVSAPSRKRARGAAYPEIEDALTRHYFTTRAMGVGRGQEVYFTNQSLKEKALSLQKAFVENLKGQIAKLPAETSDEPGVVSDKRKALHDDVKRLEGFKASNGWLAKWKKRAGVSASKRGRPEGVERDEEGGELRKVKKKRGKHSSSDQIIDQTTDETTDQTADQTTDQATDQATDQNTDQTTEVNENEHENEDGVGLPSLPLPERSERAMQGD